MKIVKGMILKALIDTPWSIRMKAGDLIKVVNNGKGIVISGPYQGDTLWELGYECGKGEFEIVSELDKFPDSGYCEVLDEALISYLSSREGVHNNHSRTPGKWVCWNSTGHWFVKTRTEQTKYELSQLTPFLTPQYQIY